MDKTEGPIDQTEGSLHQTKGPVDQHKDQLYQTKGPIDQTEGPLHQTEGSVDQTEGPKYTEFKYQDTDGGGGRGGQNILDGRKEGRKD